MNEMKYINERDLVILDQGNYQDFDYVILSLGTHPTAYIRIPKGHRYYKKHYDDINIDCHYGLTFSEDNLAFNPINIQDSWWIGWDYAHCNDQIGSYKSESIGDETKKWTTTEILLEVKNVIQQLSSNKLNEVEK